jgi:hypothetical protein
MAVTRRLWFATIVLWALSRPAAAIDVSEVVWGFDGQVVVLEFNPLSLLVSNSTSEPFEGTLRLTQSSGGGVRFGAYIDEPVFLSPFASRWVQFYPYVLGQHEEWLVTWGRGPNQRAKLPPPRLGPRAKILLDDAGLARSAAWKRLPDHLFPPFVAATGGLQSVALDYAPRWQPATAQAFLDWLHAGGELHLLHGANGQFPKFPAKLQVLNARLDEFRVGAGTVRRHNVARDQLGTTLGGGTGTPDGKASFNDFSYEQLTNDESIFTRLKQLTDPEHNWGLIYSLSTAYLLLIGPGTYVLGRRRADYRLVMGAAVGLVVLFSLAFSFVGRRGYGEATTVHSVAIARPLEDGSFDVTRWSDAFATRGANYRVTHPGSGHVYSTGQQYEAVNGVIDNGIEGSFVVDIPQYSSRPFAHRAKMPGKPFKLSVRSWPTDPAAGWEITVDENFPKSTAPIYAVQGNRYVAASMSNGVLYVPAAAQNLAELHQRLPQSHPTWGDPWSHYGSNRKQKVDAIYGDLQLPLSFRSLGIHNAAQLPGFSLPDDRIRVFVYAEMPESFHTLSDQLGTPDGYVLYCIDVVRPDVENPAEPRPPEPDVPAKE